MKILGIDYGEKRIGLALADTEIGLALPYKLLINQGGKRVIEDLKKIIEKEQVQKIVIGLPLSFDFLETQQSQKIRAWAKKIETETGLSVDFENEFLTSEEAEKRWPTKRLKKGIKDKTASVIILQAYLDYLLNKK